MGVATSNNGISKRTSTVDESENMLGNDVVEKEEKLIASTVRFGEQAHKTISDFAKEYNCSFAEIVRVAVDDALERYFGNVVYVDKKTGKEVLKKLAEIGTELDGIRSEMKRIGCNYNQDLKVKNMEMKQVKILEQLSDSNVPADVKTELKKKYSSLEAMIQASTRNVPQLDKQELENLMERLEKVSEKVGYGLWLTLR